MKKRQNRPHGATILMPLLDNPPANTHEAFGGTMQEADNVVYYGSLEAAARFGGRLGLRQQANLPENIGPRSSAFENQMEQMADPLPPTHEPSPQMESKVTQWGRCGFIPASDRF
jgi:hypothetical protein